VDFFDDDATSQAPAVRDTPPAAPPKRRRPDRRRTRIQRIAILAAVLFVIVFAGAWWARSCQHNRKIGSYRDYFNGVATAIDDSVRLGKQVNAIVVNPTKLQRKELVDKLGELATKQDEIAVRATRLEPPGSLEDEQVVFATGMRVRASGYKLLRAAMMGALGNKKVGAPKIAALDGYFSGPDAYYMQLVYLPARTVMSEEGVSDVAVPTSTYYLTWKALDLATVQSMLGRVGSSAKLTGIHGVALVAVAAQSSAGDINLAKGQTADVPASADLAFVVEVQNQGSVAESEVPVTATLTVPGGTPVKQEASIATIEPGKTQAITLTGFAIPEEALGKKVTLKVVAGPVPGERVETNNSAQFKLVLQLN